MAMLAMPELWPNSRAVMAARWFESDLRGESGCAWLASWIDDGRNERSDGIDQR